MLDTLKPTEKRLVGYAVELAVRVLDNIDSHNERVHRVTVRNGTLKTHYAQVQKTTYTFSSKSDKEQAGVSRSPATIHAGSSSKRASRTKSPTTTGGSAS